VEVVGDLKTFDRNVAEFVAQLADHDPTGVRGQANQKGQEDNGRGEGRDPRLDGVSHVPEALNTKNKAVDRFLLASCERFFAGGPTQCLLAEEGGIF